MVIAFEPMVYLIGRIYQLVEVSTTIRFGRTIRQSFLWHPQMNALGAILVF
jgi:hypothetical protein